MSEDYLNGLSMKLNIDITYLAETSYSNIPFILRKPYGIIYKGCPVERQFFKLVLRVLNIYLEGKDEGAREDVDRHPHSNPVS